MSHISLVYATDESSSPWPLYLVIGSAVWCKRCGYIGKGAGARQFRCAVMTILAGGSYVPVSLAERLSAPATRTLRQPALGAPRGLTKRQQEVFASLLKGHSAKMIAHELAIAPATVKIHLAGIYRALGARTRSEAIIMAVARQRAA